MADSVHTDNRNTKQYTPGCFGGTRVGFIEHEVENWIRSRIRVNSGQPAAAPVEPPPYSTIISIKEATRRIGCSRVHIWSLEKKGLFPQRVRLIDSGLADETD